MSESLDPGVSLTWRLLRYRWLITISTAVLAVDQGTKAWIRARLPFNTYGEAAGAIRVVRGFLYIVHVGNTDPGVSLTWRLLRYRWLITISTAVLAVDQGTKAWIRARLPFNTYGEAAGGSRPLS